MWRYRSRRSYTYVPLVGVFVAIVWGAVELSSRIPTLRYPLLTGAGLAVVALASATARNISYWHDGIRVSARACPRGHWTELPMERALGEAYYNQAHRRSAGASTRSPPDSPDRHRAFRDWHHQPAEKKFTKPNFIIGQALRYPGEARTSAQIHNNLAVLEMQQGSLRRCGEGFPRIGCPRSQFRSPSRSFPGWLLAKQGRYEEATVQYEEAVKTAPDALAYFSLGSAPRTTQVPAGRRAYRKTLALAPGFQQAQLRLKAITGNR